MKKPVDSNCFARMMIATGMVFVLAFTAVAQDANLRPVIGTVLAVRGDVSSVSSEGESRSLAPKDVVHLKDSIKTGGRGRAQIQLQDGTVISIGSDTEINLTKFSYRPDEADGEMVMTVEQGVFRVMGGAITKLAPEKFKTITPTATIGIRGSFYYGEFIPANMELLAVFLAGNGIVVGNQHGRILITTPSFGTRVPRGRGPMRQFRMRAAEMRRRMEAFRMGADGDGGNDDGSDDVDWDDGAGDDDDNGLAGGDGDGGENDGAGNRNDATFGSDAGDDANDPDHFQNDLDGALNDADGDGDDPTDSTDPTDPDGQAMSGQFLGIDLGPVANDGADDERWDGAVSAISTEGRVDATVTRDDGEIFTVSYTVSPVDESGIYAGLPAFPAAPNVSYDVPVGGTLLTVPAFAVSDNLGEFTLFYTEEFVHDGEMTTGSEAYGGELINGGSESGGYSALGFAGIPSDQVPSAGVYTYEGVGLTLVDSSERGSQSAEQVDVFAAANFRNGKFIALLDPFFDENEQPMPGGENFMRTIYYGDFTGGDFTGGQVTGAYVTGGITPSVPDGSVTFGRFYGGENQAVGLELAGDIYKVSDDLSGGTWNQLAGLFKTGSMANEEGSVTWTGFAAGVGDDITNPDVGRKYFITEDLGALMNVTVNCDTGVMNGTVTMSEPFTDSGAATTIGNATLGGTYGSAYVSDELFVFEMGGAGVVDTSGSTGDLNDHGNYFFPEAPDEQVGEWAKWGHWEAAFTDPSDGTNYHIHNPDAYWVLGQMTPATTIMDLIVNSAVGSYSGIAFCSEIIPGTGQSHSIGTAEFMVDFGARAVAGEMVLPDYVLTVRGVVRTDGTGVEGGIDNVLKNTINYTPQNSSLRAGFFGPNAETFGGTHLTDLGPGKEKFVGGFITNGSPIQQPY